MNNKLFLVLRIAVAIILLQTLFFKFSAHQDSVFIFTKLGLEPWGRIGVGILELIASILLFVPRRIGVGAGLSAGLMSGAIKMHFTKIWIEVNGDGGSLFFTLILSLTILVKNRKDLPFLNL
jgi:uncharacterized membrane protein YphA (DoxX/SURF4 family)